jgi:hypothetical protein
MPAHCRVGDIGVGICCCHPPIPCIGYVTVFVTGSSSTSADGRAEVREGDIGASTCGHATIALTGSGSNQNDGRAVHRTGDIGINCGVYVALTGSPNTTSD